MVEDTQQPQAQNGAQPQVKMQILAQFIRDLSFENAVATKGAPQGEVQPEITVQVSLDARKRGADHQYEVMTKFRVTSSNKSDNTTLFLAELDYGGVFHIEGVPEDQLHPFLMIECPRILFPFVRRIISDLTRDGGFPPFNMDPVDFVALYRQELQRRAQSQQTEAAPAADQRLS
ncbi:protein-export chaperone SecB [Paracoccus caeni]|uniref:Protein-export protein SecB n=1 Tax=Paracoccus caeni TaxID=657651 RepID=A0A934SM59_9RHOB|nr:protein-export chaperone SecB [Paracoccus caeni]MBK4217609.1 protein-export chaperone SecB [Paracoccus caeni]